MAKGPQKICTKCGSVGKPKKYVKGSFVLELGIWVLCVTLGLVYAMWLIIPAALYSIWRLTTKQQVCRICESPEIIPLNTPRAALIREQFQEFKRNAAPSNAAP